jgi:thioredoxin reductase (NADPH)
MHRTGGEGNAFLTQAHVAIIGAGPLGIELAVALKRAGISIVHFDAKQIGQTIAGFPPQTRFFSSNERIAIAGVPLQTPDQNKATREEYLTYLRTLVQQFDLRINTYEPVTGIERRPAGGFIITTSRHGADATYRADRIVLATGGTAKSRRLGVSGEDLPHVHAHWTDPHTYFQKKVLIVGGKNSAVETALRLHHAGAIVTLSYRRDKLPAKSIKYWLLPEISGLLKSGAIRDELGTIVRRITPGSVTLDWADGSRPQGLWSGDDGPWEVETDFVIPQIGFVSDMTLCRLAGVQLNGEREVPSYDPETMETNVPGVFLCGTVVGGTQHRYEIFIENGHVHVDRIVAHLTGQRKHVDEIVYAQPES